MPHRLWYRLRDPREVTAGFGLMWVVFILIGLAAMFSPPQTVINHLGALTITWASFMLLGGILGFVGCVFLREPWWRWVERTGILTAAFGVTIYFAIITLIDVASTSTSLLVNLGFIIVGFLMLGGRWVLMKYTLVPRIRISRGTGDVR